MGVEGCDRSLIWGPILEFPWIIYSKYGSGKWNKGSARNFYHDIKNGNLDNVINFA
jgi:hypothetical protein